MADCEDEAAVEVPQPEFQSDSEGMAPEAAELSGSEDVEWLRHREQYAVPQPERREPEEAQVSDWEDWPEFLVAEELVPEQLSPEPTEAAMVSEPEDPGSATVSEIAVRLVKQT